MKQLFQIVLLLCFYTQLTLAFPALLLVPPAIASEKKISPPLGLPPVPIPPNNPMTTEKIKLGEELYFDTNLSGDGSVGCITCHSPEEGFSDGKQVSEGIEGLKGTLNAPTVANAAYNKFFFWDGRALSLEEQSKAPLFNPVEHGLSNIDDLLLIVRMDANYVSKFKNVFGVEKNNITLDHIAQAISSFERTLIFGDSPFDRYFFGEEQNAINEDAKKGFEIFRGKAGCSVCHLVSNDHALFTDHKFHNLGVGFVNIANKLKQKVEAFKSAKMNNTEVDKTILTNKDLSEFGRLAVTLDYVDIGAFKTPTLRNIALTDPYMHDGSMETLEEVIQFYDKGGDASRFMANVLSPKAFKEKNKNSTENIFPLALSDQEEKQLLEFLKSLTSPGLIKPKYL